MNHRHICFWTRGGLDSTLTLRAQQLGKALSDTGWAVSYIIDDLPENESLKIDWARQIERVRMSSLFQFTRDVRRAIDKLSPEYLHILNPSPKHVPALVRSPGIKLIADFEDSHPLVHKPPRQWLDIFIERWALKKAARVISVSRFLQERFAKLGRSDTGYIPYAVLPREFPDGADPFIKPTAVWMGSFTREAELLHIVEVATWLKKYGHEQKVMMIGGGNHWERIKTLKEQRDLTNLELTGRLPWDDMLLRLRHAHALLLPLEDNLDNRTRCPFKALQYAQARRPIIASRVGEVPFLLGEKPLYVDFTPAAFGNAVTDLVVVPKPVDVDYGLDRHTWADRAQRLVKLLE